MSRAQAVQGVKVTWVCEWPGFLYAYFGPQRVVCRPQCTEDSVGLGLPFTFFFFFKGTWNLRNVNLKQMAGDIQLLFEGSPGWGDALPHQTVILVQLLSHVPLFATPWTAAHDPCLSITDSWSLLKLMSIESVMPSNHLILCCPLLLLPSILPSIRVFSNESALRIWWPKYWSFTMWPSNFTSGHISRENCNLKGCIYPDAHCSTIYNSQGMEAT